MDSNRPISQLGQSNWWYKQRGRMDFGKALATPIPLAIVLILVLGLGSALFGLMPGLDTHRVALSGAGAPWIGLLILAAVAAIWYAAELRHAYPFPIFAGVVILAAGLAVGFTALILDVLVVDWTEVTVAALGISLLISVIFGLLSLLFEGFVWRLALGIMMGGMIGLMAGIFDSLEAAFLMTLVCLPGAPLVGGTVGLLHGPILALLRRR